MVQFQYAIIIKDFFHSTPHYYLCSNFNCTHRCEAIHQTALLISTFFDNGNFVRIIVYGNIIATFPFKAKQGGHINIWDFRN